jgi:hypothetical protein
MDKYLNIGDDQCGEIDFYSYMTKKFILLIAPTTARYDMNNFKNDYYYFEKKIIQ